MSDTSSDAGPDDITGTLFGGSSGGYGGTLDCTVQVGGTGLHTDPDAALRAADSDANGIAVMNQTVTYSADPHDPVYVCTSWRPPYDTTVYWVPSADAPAGAAGEGGYWSTDPQSRCAPEAMTWSTGDVADITGGFGHGLCESTRSLHDGMFGNPDSVVHVNREGDTFAAGLKVLDCDYYDYQTGEYHPAENPIPSGTGCRHNLFANAMLVCQSDEPSEVLPAPSAGADGTGHAITVDDEVENISVGRVEPGLTARSNHNHDAGFWCDYNRNGYQVTVNAWASLTGHLGYRHTRVHCAVYNWHGAMITEADSTQNGQHAYARASGRAAVKKHHRVCVSATGGWNDGHIRGFGPYCRSA